MIEWAVLCFVMCLACDWLSVKHIYASMAGHAWTSALISAAWTGVSALGFVIALKVSLWLLLSDVLGHAVGSYLGVKYRSPS